MQNNIQRVTREQLLSHIQQVSAALKIAGLDDVVTATHSHKHGVITHTAAGSVVAVTMATMTGPAYYTGANITDDHKKGDLLSFAQVFIFN